MYKITATQPKSRGQNLDLSMLRPCFPPGITWVPPSDSSHSCTIPSQHLLAPTVAALWKNQVCPFVIPVPRVLTSTVAGAATSHGSSRSWAISARSFRIRTMSFMTTCKLTVWPLVNIWSPRRLTGRYLQGNTRNRWTASMGEGSYFSASHPLLLQATHSPPPSQHNGHSNSIQDREENTPNHLQPGSRTAALFPNALGPFILP